MTDDLTEALYALGSRLGFTLTHTRGAIERRAGPGRRRLLAHWQRLATEEIRYLAWTPTGTPHQDMVAELDKVCVLCGRSSLSGKLACAIVDCPGWPELKRRKRRRPPARRRGPRIEDRGYTHEFEEAIQDEPEPVDDGWLKKFGEAA